MQRILLIIAGILFALVAATHITRFAMEVEVLNEQPRGKTTGYQKSFNCRSSPLGLP